MAQRRKPGRFGEFGGRYVGEVLWEPLQALANAFDQALGDPEFTVGHQAWLNRRLGRPTPLTPLVRLAEHHAGGQIYIKREDAGDNGSFCAVSALGQVMLAHHMGRTTVISETATGDFGVALGSYATAFGMEAVVFMGRADHLAEAQKVEHMERLGVDVRVVDADVRGRKDAAIEAMRYWSSHLDEAFYCASSAAAPDPYPRMIAYFTATVGAELKVQLRRANLTPTYVLVPVGSGGLAAGVFGAFTDEEEVQLVGIHGGGKDRDAVGSPVIEGRRGIFLGTHSFVLSDDLGQILSPETVATGLAMPVVGPQLARWASEGTVHFTEVHDQAALAAVSGALQFEGLLLGAETGHALAYAERLLPTLGENDVVVVVASGAGQSEMARWTAEEDEG